MASVDLTGIWLALVSALEDQLHFTRVSIDPGSTVPGDFPTYANGVVRLIVSPGKSRSIRVRLFDVTREERETLEVWQSQLMLCRTSRGHLMYGSFLDLSAPETPGATALSDVCFTFRATTHSVEV